MLIYWHGDEHLAKELRDSIGNCDSHDCAKGFVEKFKARIKNSQKEEKKPILYVDKEEFTSWYFDKYTDEGVIETLRENGIVTLNDTLRGVGYLPMMLIKNPEDILPEDKKYCKKEEEIGEQLEKYQLKFAEEKSGGGV